MACIGLLGREYDECVKLLKARIEDRGHRARVVNLEHVPRVSRATIDERRMIVDGLDLLGMDCFYLAEMDIRDPFFHVQYDRELWAMLRGRYLAFAAEEIENVHFARALLEVLAERRTVINHPRVYDLRNVVPYQMIMLARSGFSVPPFRTGSAGDRAARGAHERHAAADGAQGRSVDAGAAPDSAGGGGFDELSLRMDEERVWDVYSFPKGDERPLRLRLEHAEGAVYTVVVIGERSLDRAVAGAADRSSMGRIAAAGRPGAGLVPIDELPAGAVETARRAAKALGAVFAAVELRCGGSGETIRVQRVDPSPEVTILERMLGLPVSAPLAEYLITAAGS